MRNLLLLFMVFAMVGCASTSQNIDVDSEFERLYSALGLEEIYQSFGGEIEVDIQTTIAEQFKHLPQEHRKILLETMQKENLSTLTLESDEINVNAAKQLFKAKLLALLTPEEIKIAADFYATNTGLKVHRAIIDAEMAVSESLEQCHSGENYVICDEM